MTDQKYPRSDSGSDINEEWDHHIERVDQAVFENVPDQYVKGEDVNALFSILDNGKLSNEGDRIGLLRVGCTNMKECLAFAPVKFSPSSTTSSARHGTATFPSSDLTVTDDEFYQFCYIAKSGKCLGTSIPFQLNCSVDDIDLLSDMSTTSSGNKSKVTNKDGLFALADSDNHDVLIIHTKQMFTEEKLRQENRKLCALNLRLKQENDECGAKLNSLEVKAKEYTSKIEQELQTLTNSHKIAIDDLNARTRLETKLRADYDACQAWCNQYQAEALQFAERCRQLQEVHDRSSTEVNQLRMQLAATTQLTSDQMTQLADLERRLIQSNELIKIAAEHQMQLEVQIRDLRLTSEKHQMSLQAQIDDYVQRLHQQENQSKDLQTANGLLSEELSSLREENNSLSATIKQEKETVNELQRQLDEVQEQRTRESEQAKIELQRLLTELNEMKSNQDVHTMLKTSLVEVEKRCVKHQKAEVEVKRLLQDYKSIVNDLQVENQDLTERLMAGADEYKALFRKYLNLKQRQQGSPAPSTSFQETSEHHDIFLDEFLRNANEPQKQDQEREEDEVEEGDNLNIEQDQENQREPATVPKSSNSSEEVSTCPMCYWEFPIGMTIENKQQHIDHHFT